MSPPAISVDVPFVERDARGSRSLDPGSRKELLVFPLAAMKKKVSNLGEIARRQLQIAPSASHALRIGRPIDIPHSQRPEEILLRERLRAEPSCRAQDRREQVIVGAAIPELPSRGPVHR